MNKQERGQTELLYVAAIVALVLLVAGMWYVGTYFSVRNGAVDAEAGIIEQAQFCEQQIDTGFQQMIAVAQVDQQFHENMRALFDAIFTAETQASRDEASNGLLALFTGAGVMNNTNFAVTALEIDRVIQATYQNIALCQGRLAERQSSYSQLIGRPQGALDGQAGKWPNTMIAESLRLPTEFRQGAPNAPTRDLDGDGSLTVFDYPAVLSIGGFGAQAYDTGVVTPPALFPTPAP